MIAFGVLVLFLLVGFVQLWHLNRLVLLFKSEHPDVLTHLVNKAFFNKDEGQVVIKIVIYWTEPEIVMSERLRVAFFRQRMLVSAEVLTFFAFILAHYDWSWLQS